jgi:hypothetical protein
LRIADWGAGDGREPSVRGMGAVVGGGEAAAVVKRRRW